MYRFATLVLLLAACNGKEDDTAGPDGDADTDTDSDSDTDTDTETDTDTDPQASEFGLDTRPPNATCIAPERPPSAGNAQLTRVFPGIDWPVAVAILQAPGDGDHWFGLSQEGFVYRFDDDPAASMLSIVLDLEVETKFDGAEMGMLGMAFHPDFQSNGYVYLSYNAADGGQNVSRISRFYSPDGGATLDPASRLVILQFDQPYTNHKGGWIEFGPDGFLYAGFGDGGSGDDPQERAQNPDELLGKMLRIDVDAPSGGLEYGIPASNPYASGGGREEIFAIGLRNPYRWHFDPASQDLWVGDVGQNAWEEVDLVELGGNYGWDCKEASEDHEMNTPNCKTATLIEPRAAYEHMGGSKSVIGGVVYHGAAIPELAGVYLYTDFYDSILWGLTYDPVSGRDVSYKVIDDTSKTIGHFAYGDDGEVYLLDYMDGVYRLDPKNVAPNTFPALLSETGCVDPVDPWIANGMMIPYDVNHAFWSDGSEKHRWLAIPDGTTLSVDDDGDLEFPIGTVLMKAFEKDGERIETRLMMLHPDGAWGGYSYRWREDGTDADLLSSGLAVELPSQTYQIPSRAECLQCHTPAAGGALGLELRQLNLDVTYPATNRVANAIATLDHIGMFDVTPGDPATLDAFVARDDAAAAIEEQARTYLHVNCSSCHRPDGGTPVRLDLQYDTAFADMGLCGEIPQSGDIGIQGALLLTPGDPAMSVISGRMHRRDAVAMPPSGSALVDDLGVGIVDEWITSVASCP